MQRIEGKLDCDVVGYSNSSESVVAIIRLHNCLLPLHFAMKRNEMRCSLKKISCIFFFRSIVNNNESCFMFNTQHHERGTREGRGKKEQNMLAPCTFFCVVFGMNKTPTKMYKEKRRGWKLKPRVEE
jgi:hypothetical protein